MISAGTLVRPVHAFGICNGECSHGEAPAADVVLCRAWIRRRALPRQSINYRFDSYVLKHAVENAADARDPLRWQRGPIYYVTNGAFIRAALLEGYRAVPCANGSPNAFFDMAFRKAPLPIVEVEA